MTWITDTGNISQFPWINGFCGDYFSEIKIFWFWSLQRKLNNQSIIFNKHCKNTCKQHNWNVNIDRSNGGGGARTYRRPISFIFIQFSTIILSCNRFLPQTQGSAPPVWEILDPPLVSIICWLFIIAFIFIANSAIWKLYLMSGNAAILSKYRSIHLIRFNYAIRLILPSN